MPTVFTALENQRHCWVLMSQKQECGAACDLSTSLKKHGPGHTDMSSLLLATRTLIYMIFSKPYLSSSLLLSQVLLCIPSLVLNPSIQCFRAHDWPSDSWSLHCHGDWWDTPDASVHFWLPPKMLSALSMTNLKSMIPVSFLSSLESFPTEMVTSGWFL